MIYGPPHASREKYDAATRISVQQQWLNSAEGPARCSRMAELRGDSDTDVIHKFKRHHYMLDFIFVCVICIIVLFV